MSYRLIYTSRTTHALTGKDLAGILVSAVALNGDDGITGMLMYSRNSFMQILEGEQHAVERAMKRIRRSTKHTGINVLTSAETDEPPMFPDWAMDWWVPDDHDFIAGDMPLAAVATVDQAMGIIRRRPTGA